MVEAAGSNPKASFSDTSSSDTKVEQTPWADGTTALLLSPQELLEKLSALVPPPRLHLIRYHGALTAAVARPTTLAGIATGSNGLGCWPACSRSR
jgi:hypothetical protein